ncbi:hypothetical protein VNO77_27272 [Canavalia gladiata]|uniref:Uncharacterized protein n=1 Tax=Canavalia gladiata TaxID=3824 RepID=A0AAN9Q6C0_CANGL
MTALGGAWEGCPDGSQLTWLGEGVLVVWCDPSGGMWGARDREGKLGTKIVACGYRTHHLRVNTGSHTTELRTVCLIIMSVRIDLTYGIRTHDMALRLEEVPPLKPT